MYHALEEFRYVHLEIKVKGARADVEAALRYLSGLFKIEDDPYFYHSSPDTGWMSMNATFRPAAQFYIRPQRAIIPVQRAIVPFAAKSPAEGANRNTGKPKLPTLPRPQRRDAPGRAA